jgi:hypothetical protein
MTRLFVSPCLLVGQADAEAVIDRPTWFSSHCSIHLPIESLTASLPVVRLPLVIVSLPFLCDIIARDRCSAAAIHVPPRPSRPISSLHDTLSLSLTHAGALLLY